MPCEHNWKVEWFGPTGSTYTEQRCATCGTERVTGIVSELALQLALLRMNSALIQAANNRKTPSSEGSLLHHH